ncbi:hypothetical protein EBT31_00010 [bacterium]|nr:hypothetical protein [bacterium]
MTEYSKFLAMRASTDNASIVGGTSLSSAILEEIGRIDSSAEGTTPVGIGELQRVQNLRARLLGGTDSDGVTHIGEV